MNAERAFRFGRAEHLVGVAGLPDTSPQETGVIVLSAGLVHRVGPFRLHVELSRQLNAAGYPTLRFDMSTLGDSGASSESETRVQQVRADVADAVALLSAQSGCRRIVLIGLCSGAENAHRAAVTQPGLAGAVFLDGYAFRTRGFHIRHYLPRLLNPARLARFVARKLRKRKQDAAPSFGVVFPPHEQVKQELADMLRRGLKLCFVYSGGAARYFNHLKQFRECYGAIAAHPAVEVSWLKNADHTYILTGDRRQLLDLIEQWMQRHFPRDAARPPA